MAVKTKRGKSAPQPDRNERLLDETLARFKGKPGSLIPALHRAQTLYGYLPRPVIEKIARELRVPLSEVWGVITFYAFFSTEPKGRNDLRVCMGTACFVKGADRIVNELKRRTGVEEGGKTADGKFSLGICRCLGCCSIAPVVSVNGKIHQKVTPASLGNILAGCK
jgi:NADH:ubiquinone oxidoreductase subunit E